MTTTVGMENIVDKLLEKFQKIGLSIEKDPMDLGGIIVELELARRVETIYISRTTISPQKGIPRASSWYMIFLELMHTASERIEESDNHYGKA